MLKIAFASGDRVRVNQHFGAAEGFVLYEVSPTRTSMVGVAEFPPEAMDGNENKLGAKVAFLEGCAAVFVLAIGASAIKQLVAQGTRPIRITETDKIEDLLYDITQGMKHGGVAWIDQAMAERAPPERTPDRFAAMQEEGWEG